MLTKTALNKLTQAVSSRISQEVSRYNQKLVDSVTEGDLFEDYCRVVLGKDIHINATWDVLKNQFPPVFTELLACLRENHHKVDKLNYPMGYRLFEIIRPEVERLTANLEEFDSEALLTDQLFEKVYPMLVEAKYIHFESEKFEPTFELTQSAEEEVVFAPLKSEDLESDTMIFNGDNDAWEYEGSNNALEDEEDWE